MNKKTALLPQNTPDLTNRLDERKRLYVTDGTTDFGDNHPSPRGSSSGANSRLDFIRNVRNNLYGSTSVSSRAFTVQNSPVHAPRSRAIEST